jgi:nucleotide-binding universal stress UspA family protein
MNRSPPPILVYYDGSPAAVRAIDAAGTLFPGRRATVLYVWRGMAGRRVRTTSVEGVREELIGEVRVATRREAAAVADEGTSLGRRAGLEARPLTVETGGRAADAIVRVATKESAAAVVIGRPSRTRRVPLLSDGVLRNVVDHCPIPLVVV